MPLFRDTSPDAERALIELVRRAPVSKRIGTTVSLTRTAIELSRRAISRANPEFDERGVGVKFVELHYGPELARGVARRLEERHDDA